MARSFAACMLDWGRNRCDTEMTEKMQEVPALPEAGTWHEPADLAAYAEQCLAVLGLGGWRFCWDRAVRRLGCCNYAKKQISLSRHYVAAYLLQEPDMVRRTLLHELAHALAMTHHRARAHGRIWQYYCAALGIAGERATCKCGDFTPPHYRPRRTRYVLCHCETGEIFRRYTNRPRTALHKVPHLYIVGRKAETLGKLCFRRVEP